LPARAKAKIKMWSRFELEVAKPVVLYTIKMQAKKDLHTKNVSQRSGC
jgi:hypothetical protein